MPLLFHSEHIEIYVKTTTTIPVGTNNNNNNNGKRILEGHCIEHATHTIRKNYTFTEIARHKDSEKKNATRCGPIWVAIKAEVCNPFLGALD